MKRAKRWRIWESNLLGGTTFSTLKGLGLGFEVRHRKKKKKRKKKNCKKAKEKPSFLFF